MIVPNPAVWPFRAVGRLVISSDGKLYTGTGTLIGPRHVITAAHNVPASKNAKLIFNPGQQGGTPHHGSHGVVDALKPNEWKKFEDLDWDLAVLILSQNIGETTGYYGIHLLESGKGAGLGVRILGYPTPANGQMWLHDTQITKTTSERLIHNALTQQGESGSPICVQDSTGRTYIVGLHTYREDGYAFGPKLTPLKLEFIKACLS